MATQIAGAAGPIELVWDRHGIAHVYAETQADAYRGMGWAAASERLWQIHQSTAYANGEAAALLGPRFVPQDALVRACDVPGRQFTIPDSPGDWVAEAYLDGMNAVVNALDEVPPEFRRAGAEPRLFTMADIAARYRFTAWFQHKSWTEKMALGRLMARHGVDWFRHHVLHLTDADLAVVGDLAPALRHLDLSAWPLAYPEAAGPLSGSLSGSNNWAVTGALSTSGKGLLATDPHQPHSIPNTFFHVHLHAGDWDVAGAAFPGVPYFMMGWTRDLAWGLTTGFVDNYDIYVEELRDGQARTAEGWEPLERRNEHIPVRGGDTVDLQVVRTANGPLLEPLTQQLGTGAGITGDYGSALHWSLADLPTSAGALALLPMASTAEAFGEALFEDDVCPLVNNIICVDRNDGLRRFIATTMPARSGVSGSVPLAGWRAEHHFRRSTAAELTAEVDPASGYSFTANNDTMGDTGPYPIHNFPTHSARADRIRELLEARDHFSPEDFRSMQLDLADRRATALLPDLLGILADSPDPDVRLAHDLLAGWDHRAAADSAAACVWYPFLDRRWHRKLLREVLHDPLTDALATGAPGLNRFDVAQFLAAGSPWLEHRATLESIIRDTMASVVQAVRTVLGDDPTAWRWGDLHRIHFQHRLAGEQPWQDMACGPDPIGGSATTLAMAMHDGPGPGRAKEGDIPCRVYHGPAFRLVVDLADPGHAQLAVAGGNGGRPDSPFVSNLYPGWRDGEWFTVVWPRDEVAAHRRVALGP